VDEKAHYDFFFRCVKIYLDHDRATTLEQLRSVMHNFAMPAIYEMADSQARVTAIKEMQLFSEDIFYREVYLPILNALGVDRQEMRHRVPRRKAA
jgi:hypothetical protein